MVKEEQLKYCKYCDTYKSFNLFRHNKCKMCYKITRQKYYQNNKEKLNNIGRENRIKNIEQRRSYDKTYKDTHRENMRYKDRERYHKNKEKNQLIRRERDRVYKKRNKEKINQKNRNRRKRDPQFRLRCYMSNAVNRWLDRGKSTDPNKSYLQFLPFTIAQLKAHIESLFEPWMNWNNQGKYDPKTWKDNDSSTWKWQIDHIIPQMKFKYISVEDDGFKRCWSLNNLRPYSAKQNIIDGNRIRNGHERAIGDV